MKNRYLEQSLIAVPLVSTMLACGIAKSHTKDHAPDAPKNELTHLIHKPIDVVIFAEPG